tara:strand:- start:1171 stop:1566 length:396 start_codon:yes stop_codon:yes gene_type:complete
MFWRRKPSVLIVEDHDPLRLALGEMLTKAGYSVIVSAHGDEASEILMTHHFDLLITDIFMPDVDGYALINRLRTRMDPARRPKVIVMSGGQQRGLLTDDTITVLRRSVDAFLRKPMPKRIFLNTIYTVLNA